MEFLDVVSVDTPPALLELLSKIPGMEVGQRRLVILFSQLGDFDSLEYAQALSLIHI